MPRLDDVTRGRLLHGGDWNPEQWPEETWQEDVRLMREAGVNSVTLGVFSWSRIEPRPGERDFGWLDRLMDLAHDHGIGVVLATPTASPPPWMGRLHPDTLPADADGHTELWGGRQHFSHSSATYRRLAAAITEDLAARYAGHPALTLWHINNEYCTYDHGDEAAARFRTWLRHRHGTLDALNTAWGTAFWSQTYGDWAEVLPPRRTHYLKNPAQVLDFRRFTSDMLLECFTAERDIVRRHTPQVPVTTNVMPLWSGLDAWRWAEEQDVVSVDLYPDPDDPFGAQHGALVQDMTRSQARGPWMLMEQAAGAVNWRPVNRPKPRGLNRLWSLQAVARGADAVCSFQWRQSRQGAEKFHSGMLGHALLERLFAAGRYHLLSASGLLPPRLTGLWTGDWDTAWSGALTLDANLGLQTASAAAAALPEVTEALTTLVQAQLPHWRDNARAVFGARGVVAPAHTDGESGHSYHFSREYPLHLWTAGADWLLKPLADHDETYGTRDPRTAGALAEVADFYEDFLTRTGPDGLLAVVPSYSPENRPANGGWGALNAAMDLSAARHALHTAAAYHPDRADRLRALAGRLPPHRVNADGALAEWAWPGLKDTYDHRHLSHLYGVWPLDEITPDDTPDLAAAARRALELRGPENDSAHGHLHHALVAARLRDGRRAAAALGRVLDGDFFHDSLMSSHYPHRSVYNADAAHTLPAVLIETLVQSAPDRLVLLPAPLPALPRGRLTGVRTRFGAALDLTWTPDGGTAVLRPDRTRRITLWTPAGAAPLDLAAGEERVIPLPAATR
ncbi:hypothetical protein SALBM217S_02965 [Streptomyces griseoloalbus]